MTTIVIHRNISTPRTKKFRNMMIMHGFKRVQRWVIDIQNVSVQTKMRQEALNLHETQEMQEWSDFSVEQIDNIEDWK